MTKGMFVDTSVCIGCKACQVACKQWNELGEEPSHFEYEAGLPSKPINFTGDSYNNTGSLSAYDWREVKFIEQGSVLAGNMAWLMMSDSCKHCTHAGCLEACPTHAIVRTDLGNVIVQQDVCNGCRDCIAACPFDVISFNHQTGKVNKCTLCNDRIHNGLETACAKVCPTDSIVYGDVDALRTQAAARVQALKRQGFNKAHIYGDTDILGGLNVFYLLLDEPEVYGQPRAPQLPERNLMRNTLTSVASAIMLGVGALLAFRRRGGKKESV